MCSSVMIESQHERWVVSSRHFIILFPPCYFKLRKITAWYDHQKMMLSSRLAQNLAQNHRSRMRLAYDDTVCRCGWSSSSALPTNVALLSSSSLHLNTTHQPHTHTKQSSKHHPKWPLFTTFPQSSHPPLRLELFSTTLHHSPFSARSSATPTAAHSLPTPLRSSSSPRRLPPLVLRGVPRSLAPQSSPTVLVL